MFSYFVYSEFVGGERQSSIINALTFGGKKTAEMLSKGVGGMAILELKRDGGYFHFDREQCASVGASLGEAYRSAHPFPSIAMDDFLDADILRQILREFPSRDGVRFFNRAQERFKYQFGPDHFSGPTIRNLMAELNSDAFVQFLSEMTGISGLIPDPYFVGGGLHETLPGGHLSIHADFNIHGDMKVERRLNLLIYLNDDWDPSYGGELELWDARMRGSARSILPIMGRAVVFSTTSKSFHGQPDPVKCPEGRSRRSIATYYYTAFRVEADIPVRSTMFQARPGTDDKPDWKVRYRHFVNDWVPPRLQRIAKRLAP